MEEEAAGGGGGGGGGDSKEKLENMLTNYLTQMSARNQFFPQVLFRDFIPAIVNPGTRIQPLIVPLFEEGNNYFPGISSSVKNIIEKTRQPIVAEPLSNDDLENNINLAPNNSMAEEAESFHPSAFEEGSTSNFLKLNGYGKDFIQIKSSERPGFKTPVVIAQEVKNAVFHIFSDKATQKEKSDIQNYPIYFITAYPKGRHLSLVIFYQGILYSCGVGGTVEMKGEVESAVSGAAAMAPTAVTLGSGGAVAAAATGAAGGYSIGNASPSARSSALLVSPDYMYKGINSRIFHMGILMSQHITRLERYLSLIKDSPILNFKKNHVFESQLIGYKFILNISFTYYPVLPSTYTINCTKFILSIFGDKIACPSAAGDIIPDPQQCIIKNLAYILKTQKGRPFLDLLKNLNISSWFTSFIGVTSEKDYHARDAYITYLLARFITVFLLEKEDMYLIYDLVDPLKTTAGGRRKSKTRRRRCKSKRKSKSKHSYRPTSRRNLSKEK